MESYKKGLINHLVLGDEQPFRQMPSELLQVFHVLGRRFAHQIAERAFLLAFGEARALTRRNAASKSPA